MLKGGDQWQSYESTSVLVGDIVRLMKGDIIPADLVLLSLGMEHYYGGGGTAGMLEGKELDWKELELLAD